MNRVMRLLKLSLGRLALLTIVVGGCADPGGASVAREDGDPTVGASPTVAPTSLGWQWAGAPPEGAPRDAGVTGCSPLLCRRAAEVAQKDLATWSVPVRTCCRTRTQCGVEADPDAQPPRPAAASIVQGIQEVGCVAPLEFQTLAWTFRLMAEAPLQGTPLPVRDGGVALPDGGTIVLDEQCPTLDGDTGLFTFSYPGCCLSSGECGNSNHTLPGLAASGEQVRCLSFEELESTRSEFIPVPERPTACGAGLTRP